MEGEAPVKIWEPGKRLTWEESRGEGAPPRVVDFTIEAREGGKTVLRLVHSGFGEGASFDSEYDSTHGGWSSFFALLRDDIEHHRGEPGRHLVQMKMVDREPAALMRELLDAVALQHDGAGFTAVIPGLGEHSGRVLFYKAPGHLALAVDTLAGSGLGLFAEGFGGKTALTTSWYLKGPAVARAGEIEKAWDSALPAG